MPLPHRHWPRQLPFLDSPDYAYNLRMRFVADNDHVKTVIQQPRAASWACSPGGGIRHIQTFFLRFPNYCGGAP